MGTDLPSDRTSAAGSSTIPDERTFDFLGLLAELRDAFYDCSLVSRPVECVSPSSYPTTIAISESGPDLALLQLNRQVYSEYKQRLKKTAALQIEDGGIVPIMTRIRRILPGLQVVELRLVVHGPYVTQACQELAMHQEWVGGLRASLPQVDFHTMLYTPQEPGVLYPRIVWCDRAVHAALQNFVNRIMPKSIAVSTFDNADKHRQSAAQLTQRKFDFWAVPSLQSMCCNDVHPTQGGRRNASSCACW
ncbi:hypothetical protein LTR53_009393 [Teratosphaeriaceae sp. CCFEE 6253]|nr:hypothetical protein LTR53_009393 [Teratosphaeriaceae sp. CCFEE 6253]